MKISIFISENKIHQFLCSFHHFNAIFFVCFFSNTKHKLNDDQQMLSSQVTWTKRLVKNWYKWKIQENQKIIPMYTQWKEIFGKSQTDIVYLTYLFTYMMTKKTNCIIYVKHIHIEKSKDFIYDILWNGKKNWMSKSIDWFLYIIWKWY